VMKKILLWSKGEGGRALFDDGGGKSFWWKEKKSFSALQIKESSKVGLPEREKRELFRP